MEHVCDCERLGDEIHLYGVVLCACILTEFHHPVHLAFMLLLILLQLISFMMSMV